MKWPISSLGSIAILDRQSIHPSEVEATTPYLGLEHLDGDGGIDCTQTVGSTELKSSKFQFSDRHILFGKLRPYLRKIVRPGFSGICSSDIIPILPREGVLRDYLFYFLRSPATVNLATSRSTGANLPRLGPKQLASFQIPLPPIEEQKRIASILDKANALIANHKAALAQLNTLKQSIFLDMFGDPTTNPMGWPRSRLGDVTSFYAGTTLPEGEAFDGQENGYFLVKVSDMNLPGNEVYLESCQQWSTKPGTASSTCPAASVVIPKRGGAIGTNKKRISVRPSVLDPNLMAIWPRPDLIELSFLYSWLLRLDLASITSGSSVPQLNKRDLDPLSIPVPPLEIQREFSQKLGTMEEVIVLHYRALAVCDTLFSTLQHRAFQGEL